MSSPGLDRTPHRTAGSFRSCSRKMGTVVVIDAALHSSSAFPFPVRLSRSTDIEVVAYVFRRNCERQTFSVVTRRLPFGHADHAAFAVEHRASRVAGTDRGGE